MPSWHEVHPRAGGEDIPPPTLHEGVGSGIPRPRVGSLQEAAAHTRCRIEIRDFVQLGDQEAGAQPMQQAYRQTLPRRHGATDNGRPVHLPGVVGAPAMALAAPVDECHM